MSTSNIALHGIPRKPKKSQRKVASFMMTVIAIVFTLLPLFTIGLWATQFFDSRASTLVGIDSTRSQ